MNNLEKYYDDMKAIQTESIKIIEKFFYQKAEISENVNHSNFNINGSSNSVDFFINMDIPKKGRNYEEVGNELVDKLFSKALSTQHPKFFSYVASSVSPYSVLGAVLSDIFNINGASSTISPEASVIEYKLISWLGSRAGFNGNTGGLFLSGGSISNFTAIVTARDNILKEGELQNGVAFISDQTHSSSKKGLRLAGLRQDQIVTIPSDDDFKMRVDLLEEAIEREKANGRIPFIVIGSCGSTNTGSIDPLSKLGDIATKHNMWFHVDGAYGGSILFSDIYKNLASGIEKADSFSWDFHKWALQTYSCSAVIVKDKEKLINAFVEHPEYLADAQNEEITSAWDLGPEMSRPHRCLKLWYTLQAMGTDLMADVIDYAFYNAKVAEKELLKLENWEILSHPSCGTLNFRYVPDGYSDKELDNLTESISKMLLDEGFAHIVTTTLKGKKALRMCIINGSTKTTDVIETIAELDRIAKNLAK